MKEYIEREAAISACYDGYADNRDDCAENIRKLTAADVVAVVRCGECRYRQYDVLFHQSYCNGNRVTDDWYCADGERLTNCGARMDGGGDA